MLQFIWHNIQEKKKIKKYFALLKFLTYVCLLIYNIAAKIYSSSMTCYKLWPQYTHKHSSLHNEAVVILLQFSVYIDSLLLKLRSKLRDFFYFFYIHCSAYMQPVDTELVGNSVSRNCKSFIVSAVWDLHRWQQ